MLTSTSTLPAASPALAAIDLECLRSDNLLFTALDFTLTAGQYLQVEGANGSGKSSLLRILSGLTLPSAGRVLWRGSDILAQRSAYCSEMAYLGHALGIKAELSALENLQISLALTGAPYHRESLYQVLEQTGLQGREEVPGRALSAGQKQRIALARVLASQAILWILDEPFTALDATGVNLVCRLLEQHLGRGGMAVLTSHQPVAISGEAVRISLS